MPLKYSRYAGGAAFAQAHATEHSQEFLQGKGKGGGRPHLAEGKTNLDQQQVVDHFLSWAKSESKAAV
jgi:hypothetical protein